MKKDTSRRTFIATAAASGFGLALGRVSPLYGAHGSIEQQSAGERNCRCGSAAASRNGA